ncbi:polysaccharide pyruvyl transferase family protein [Anditalea andensis]|uniref:Polysaccharide pyruvyl transferase domain-containing protein n=1 Tax=Anditalea andensis TaxID=1048983 RepID=A0A074KW29_9BACT|nr:polysaccharide pyruvyl transferase family protein [Anditalea andensis]KEO71828.1 hypothetical protein EL17_21140 [Anditalea andensis]
MTIGIWGLYDKGNFGDDLMAAMFFKFLKNKKYDIIIYNASSYLKEELKANSTNNIDDFVRKCDVVIIGGGGMLVNNSLLKFLLKKTEFQFEYSFFKLLKALKKYNKRIIPVSIGGANSADLNNIFKKTLFTSKYTVNGTVRLKSDLELVQPDIFTYLPDVVLSTYKFFPKSIEAKGTKKRIILNLKNKNATPLIETFKKYEIFDKFEVFSFSSHAESKKEFGSYEYVLADSSFKYAKLTDAINFLSTSDLVISSKLHVGVTALSYNIPFISYNGPQKAKEFLKEYGKVEWIESDPEAVVKKILSFDMNFLEFSPNNQNVDKSYGHFDVLSKSLSSI